MNDQASRGPPAFHRFEDLIEWDNDVIESAEIKLQREVCARHPARDCDRPLSQPSASFFVRRIGAKAFPGCRHHHWAIAIAHAGAAGQKRVPVAYISKCVNRDRGDVQLAAKGPFIQCLNIFKPMLETIPTQIDFVFRHRIKHESIVWIRRVTQRENARFRRHGCTLEVTAKRRNARGSPLWRRLLFA